MSRFTLRPRGPYALAAYNGEPGVLRLAFVADPAFAPGGAEWAVGVARPAIGRDIGTLQSPD